MSLIRVHVVTYRRPRLLARALKSIISQTEQSWIVEVINDDPADGRVNELIRAINDPRVTLSEPCIKRGGAANFNYAFRALNEPFATILEDDNWWEPTFLEVMIDSLRRFPTVQLAVGNENIWLERQDGTWEATKQTIWNESNGSSLFSWRIEDKLGSAKICNSSMVWRTDKAADWRTPDFIPVDVTEHFRERIIPHPILLIHEPLVNYAVTLNTNRNVSSWGLYQVMLIGSALARTDEANRVRCAELLWQRARNGNSPLKTSLINTGIAVPAARILWTYSTFAERCRWYITLLKNVSRFRLVLAAMGRPEWKFLMSTSIPTESDAALHPDRI